jgi:hypothetical protein
MRTFESVPTKIGILDILILVFRDVIRTNFDTLVVHVLWGMNSAMSEFRNVRNPVCALCAKIVLE